MGTMRKMITKTKTLGAIPSQRDDKSGTSMALGERPHLASKTIS